MCKYNGCHENNMDRKGFGRGHCAVVSMKDSLLKIINKMLCQKTNFNKICQCQEFTGAFAEMHLDYNSFIVAD